MKLLSLLLFTLISSQLMAANFGFLTKDNNNNVCFIGIYEDTYTFAGSVSNKNLSKDQKTLMKSCQRLKSEGEPAIIKVWKTFEKQIDSDGIIRYVPKINVDCVLVNQYDDFLDVLKVWRYEVENSNFKKCS